MTDLEKLSNMLMGFCEDFLDVTSYGAVGWDGVCWATHLHYHFEAWVFDNA